VLPDADLSLIGTSVIDERLVLLDYRVRGFIGSDTATDDYSSRANLAYLRSRYPRDHPDQAGGIPRRRAGSAILPA
jgi:hypothetical protein